MTLQSGEVKWLLSMRRHIQSTVLAPLRPLQHGVSCALRGVSPYKMPDGRAAVIQPFSERLEEIAMQQVCAVSCSLQRVFRTIILSVEEN